MVYKKFNQYIKLIYFCFCFSILLPSKTIAISYFDNTSDLDDYNPLSKGLADMLITDLSKLKSIQIVEREKLEKILSEIDLGSTDFMDKSTAQKLGNGLGAEYILTGSYLIMGETMRIDARLIDVDSGEISMAEEITGNKNEFFSLEKKLVDKLISTLKIAVSKSEKRKIKKVQTESFDSFNAYSSALDALDNGDIIKSQEFLSKAVEIDEDFDVAWDKLDEIIELIDQLEQSRGTGLSIHLIKQVERLAALNGGECNEFAKLYVSLLGSVNNFIEESGRDYQMIIDTTVLISNWKEFLLPSKPKTWDESVVMLSQKIYEAQQILELLLSKSYSNKPCGVMGNPNSVAMSGFVEMIANLYEYYSADNFYNPKLNIINNEGEVIEHAKNFPKIIIKYGTKLRKDFPLWERGVSNEYLKKMISIVENINNSSSDIIRSLKASNFDINISDFIDEKHLWLDVLDLNDLSKDIFNPDEPRTVQINYEKVFFPFLFDSGPKPQLNLGYPDAWENSLPEKQIYFLPESIKEFQNVEIIKLVLVAHSLPNWFYEFKNLKVLDLAAKGHDQKNYIESYNLKYYNSYVFDALMNFYNNSVQSGNEEEIEYLGYELKKWEEFKSLLTNCDACQRGYNHYTHKKPRVDSIKANIKLLSNLEVLDLTNNYITYIDDDIRYLKKLKYLILSGNPIAMDTEKIDKIQNLIPSASIVLSEDESYWQCASYSGDKFITLNKCKNRCYQGRECQYHEGNNVKDLYLFNYFKDRVVPNLSDKRKGHYDEWQVERKNYYKNLERKEQERLERQKVEEERKEQERLERQKVEEERKKEERKHRTIISNLIVSGNTNVPIKGSTPISNSVVMGNLAAPITIMYFFDFQ